ncbi:MAG: PA2779 family protein [Betaproteobacteria bacterium]|nr:PA2779 family protein [Betaproteobacteria bacterium]
MKKTALFRRIAAVLVLTILHLAVAAPARAALVGTERVTGHVPEPDPQTARTMRRAVLAAELTRLGMSPAEAHARVSVLTDAEVDSPGSPGRIPAGGGVVGVAVFVFAVLVMTDVLGYTRIFPFTSSLRR